MSFGSDVSMDEFDVEDMLTEAVISGDADDFDQAVEAAMIWADEDVDEFWRVVSNSSASAPAVMRAIRGESETDLDD